MYDEFGNYIGPELDSEEESGGENEKEEVEDDEEMVVRYLSSHYMCQLTRPIAAASLHNIHCQLFLIQES